MPWHNAARLLWISTAEGYSARFVVLSPRVISHINVMSVSLRAKYHDLLLNDLLCGTGHVVDRSAQSPGTCHLYLYTYVWFHSIASWLCVKHEYHAHACRVLSGSRRCHLRQRG